MNDLSPCPPVPELIERTRSRSGLAPAHIAALIGGHLAGRVPDYQISAWLMAVTCSGLSSAETAELTRVLADTGQCLHLGQDTFVADKHSTGGVGDNVTLVLAPLLAAVGIPMAKMSGRSLGHHGGTVDKLEAIPGLVLPTTPEQVKASLETTGMAIATQSSAFAPGDAALYRLRDVTATVDSLPLIAASVMSKKLATGASVVVLDVKTGGGAMMRHLEDARALAELMVAIGCQNGLPTRAVISDMNQPLGSAIGNSLEVAEALHVLAGGYVPRLNDLVLALAGQVAAAAWPAVPNEVVDARLRKALTDGSAQNVFRTWVGMHGGDVASIDDPARLPRAPHVVRVLTPSGGVVQSIDAAALGGLAGRLGAAREQAGAAVDPASGIRLLVGVGAKVEAGADVAELHTCTGGDAELLAAAQAAFTIGDAPAAEPPLVHQIITGDAT
ncbi:thymidine phosphorylase [Nonomuraea sp. FMUSA5-5]|uniref:Thymidine phosphorylase n=1 Tax=Nonomuraea composti TaxID=2720023 RepID=A0ABX1BEW8_9ACTN|nr:thymidine phosphorylase [Nonomuraea sp. FMUSA5-5]NJP95432.1 thymidine phosphorylase [Nonomuraea sp. FMUSA5-5]